MAGDEPKPPKEKPVTAEAADKTPDEKPATSSVADSAPSAKPPPKAAKAPKEKVEQPVETTEKKPAAKAVGPEKEGPEKKEEQPDEKKDKKEKSATATADKAPEKPGKKVEPPEKKPAAKARDANKPAKKPAASPKAPEPKAVSKPEAAVAPTPAPAQAEIRRTITDLKDLGEAVDGDAAPVAAGESGEPVAATAVVPEPQRDALGRAYATGKRKNAIARVWLKPGQGQITVNGRESDTYFARPVLRMLIGQPLVAARRETEFDVWCTVKGGGLSGQAGAVRHGISRALVNYEPDLRPVLKSGGFLTRDSRVVERKKYGRAKARRSFQFSKR